MFGIAMEICYGIWTIRGYIKQYKLYVWTSGLEKGRDFLRICTVLQKYVFPIPQ